MAQLTMAQAYAYARQAGFDPASAVIAAAIASAESGLSSNAIGDQKLADATWGPSVGLMQIRTLKSQTGTGRDRDVQLLGDPLQNMVAAYHISSGGRDWSPWAAYSNGSYRKYLGQAGQSAQGFPALPAGLTSATPVGWTSDVAGVARDWSVRLLIVGLGVGLVVAGSYRAWQPAVAKAVSVGKKAASVAVMV